jgi:hypothetical protein
MRSLTLFMTCLLVYACNPVRQILRSPEKTQEVVDSYLKYHKIKSDTVLAIQPGETIIDTVEQYIRVIPDTIHIPGTNTRETIYRYITKSRTDTLRVRIRDREFEDGLQRQNTTQAVLLDQQAATIKSWKRYAWITWIAIAAVILLLILLRGRRAA